MTDTKLKYADLSDAVKQSLRDKYRNSNVEHDWWDVIFDDAVYVGELLGVTSEARHIHFSGFWNQGDGASFSGRFKSTPSSAAVREYAPQDEELHRIADALTVLHARCMLLHSTELKSLVCRTNSRCARNGSMYVNLHAEYESFAPDLLQLMRDFADWIYEQLEAEYEYQTSDEAIDEWLAEQEFDEAGNML